MKDSALTSTGALRNQYGQSGNLDIRIELHRRFTVGETDFGRWVRSQMNLVPGMKILEAGCGEGGLWRAQPGEIPPVELELTDLSEGMLNTARERLANSPLKIRLQKADVCGLPFESGSFDMAVANHMLYHVPDRARAISELRRVVKEDGTLICSTAGRDNMRELWALIGECLETDPEELQPRLSFERENGAEQLMACFSRVEWVECPAHLEVDRADMLARYAGSMQSMIGRNLPEGWQNRLERMAQERIDRDGSIWISKSAGLFRCRP